MSQLKSKFDNNYHLITTVAGLITGYPEDVQETFARLITDKYLDAADKLLYTRYGERECRTEDPGIINMEILSYLIINAAYYKKCLAYIDAEYNPVENYSSIEEETIKTEYGERGESGSNTKAQDTFQHGAHTDSVTEGAPLTQGGQGGYTVETHTAKVERKTTPPGDTSTVQTAPFESSEFFNQDKTTVTHTEGTETVKRVAESGDSGNDLVTFSQKKDISDYQQYNDIAHVGNTEDSWDKTVDEVEDNVTRNLSRSGNIGVMTAAQMMKEDKEFWKSFGWLSDMAHDIANLLTVGVWAL